MGGYNQPLLNADTISQVLAASNGTTDVELAAAPGIGKRIIGTWLSIANRSATPTVIDIKSGSTVIASFVAPADYSGALAMLPTPLVFNDNQAANFVAEDAGVAANISITMGYGIGPAKGSVLP